MKFKFLTLFVLLTSLFCAAFGQDNGSVTTTAIVTQTPSGYMLGPGDVVDGRVLGEDQFNFISTVDEDGKIQVPFFEEGVPAKCKTEKELRSDIVRLLSRYLKNPQVSVRVTERKSRPPVTVSGEVKTPAQLELRRQTRLLEVITFSGGVTDDSNGMIQVFHTQPPMCGGIAGENQEWREGEIQSRMYSLSSLMQGTDDANPVIYPGDLIVVQKASPIYVTGEVRQPIGLYLKEGGLSLTQAIAMVGGVNREAKTKDIKIYRLKANSKDREVIAVNYDLIKKGTQKDVMLQPYDIVEVDKSKKSVLQTIAEIAIGVGKSVPMGLGSALPQRVLY